MRLLGVAALCAATIAPFSAGAFSPKDAAYYCVVEFAGGLAFDQATKRWHSTTFRPSGNFVLKLKYVSSREEPTSLKDFTIKYQDFNVAITETGEKESLKCFNPRDYTAPASVTEFDSLYCNASLSEYRFNFKSNRFLRTYAIGYVDGKDDNNDTPAIAGGTCTKID